LVCRPSPSRSPASSSRSSPTPTLPSTPASSPARRWPEVIGGQITCALGSGGGLSDFEALNADPPAKELFGVEKFADQSQAGAWLREQTPANGAALRDLLREFGAWDWAQAKAVQLRKEKQLIAGGW